MIENLKKFFGDISISGCNAQISTLNTVFGIATDFKSAQAVIDKNSKEDLYILGGVISERKTRAKDEHIISKNYFFFDFDVRNDYKKQNNGVDISDDEIIKIADYVEQKLATHDLLKHWKYMIFTGNGIHVYFFGDVVDIKNKRWWSLGVDNMMNEVLRITGMQPDIGCKNVSRIARLPNSYNHKHGNCKLVKIIKYQESSFDIEKIQKIGEDQDKVSQPEQKKQQPQQQVRENTLDVINEIPIAGLVCELTGWSLDSDGIHFIDGGSSKQKACFVADNGNFLVHGGTDHLPHSATGFSPFEFVRAQLNLNAAETFSWFKKRYSHIMTVSIKESERKKKESFPFIGLDKMVDASIKYIDELDPSSILSYGYKPLDDHIGGIYPSEVVLIGGESGTGKTSFLTSVLKHNARRHKVVFFSLEDTLNDYTLKQIWFEIGKIRKLRDLKNYPWKDFRNNLITDTSYLVDRAKAEESIKEDANLIFYDRGHEDAPDKMDIDTLEQLIDKAVERGHKLIGVDHLHFFNINESKASRATSIEQIMQRIKTLSEKHDIAIILLAHYKKLYGDKPSLDSFKDSSGITQTANIVINMWRDRSDDLGTDINETHFMMPKVRSPVGEKTIIMQFNPYTFTYDYIDQKIGTTQNLSERKRIELLKSKKVNEDPIQMGAGLKDDDDLPF